MENRYYLLENVKKPAELVKDYTAYKGAKSQLEDQLREEEPLFDCGDIRLRDLKRDTRKGHKYLHLLVDGTDSDFRGFENYAESQEVKILGARSGNEESLDGLVDTYLPKKTANKCMSALKNIKELKPDFDDFVSQGNFIVVGAALSASAGIVQFVGGLHGAASGEGFSIFPNYLVPTLILGGLSWYGSIKSKQR